MLSKREVKKSYYVWFLGAQEARAARGVRPALATLHRLERRAHDLDPFKVTLQVSPKGLKIIQNVDGRVKGGRGRAHTVKHFLPAESVTEVAARGDAVVCVLLLYNPVTRCPLHAHAYRCDSEQTAQALCAQLRSVAGLGPEEEDEEPIPPEELPESIDGPQQNIQEHRLAPEQELAAERLAAELRRRLAGREPLLLPPRDYDTMRRGPNVPAPVTAPTAGRRLGKGVLGSSAGSSGIGSDLAPSPDRPHTSSEEDWTESTAYMLHEGYEVSARRARSPSPVKQSNRNAVSADRAIARNDRSNSQSHSIGSVSPKDRFNVAKEKFMNLEREKITEEVDKRAQMRRNLNQVLSRGPKSPNDLQNHRSNPKWPSDEEDIVFDRRPEMPRVRTDARDQRNFREPRDDRDLRDHRMSREFRDPRIMRDVQDSRDIIDYRGPKEPLDMRELKDVKPLRDSRDYREYRSNDVRDFKDVKDPKRYVRDEREYKEFRDPREQRDPRDPRDPRDMREVRNYNEQKDAKYLREYRDVDDVRDMRNEDVRRHSRERTPQMEHRFYEYRGGERNDKYFDNRYKHDSRSDDEGVESEKQFEEIRYVPHVELPRRREPETRMNKLEPAKKEVVRDGRIELLEERQRQMESKRLMKTDIDDRYDRDRIEVQRRPQPDSRDWEVIRRSYAEAERPRRDARARHSYAEPVARTRVGMATVAPF